MEKSLIIIEVADNGGRRKVQDRRFLVSVPHGREQRTNWDRRCGYDRRLRRIIGFPEDRRVAEEEISG